MSKAHRSSLRYGATRGPKSGTGALGGMFFDMGERDEVGRRKPEAGRLISEVGGGLNPLGNARISQDWVFQTCRKWFPLCRNALSRKAGQCDIWGKSKRRDLS
jgi:hypothetical protein